MEKTLFKRNQKGFTLIEIIAVLVILGILAAVAIPKYLDMREDAVKKALAQATTELNARERLALAQYKLQDGTGTYPPPDTKLGDDWNSNTAIATGSAFTFEGKSVQCTKTDATSINEPSVWKCALVTGT